MKDLKGKKILFIAPKFHNLQNSIYEEMISLGAEVDYFDERPKNDFFTKVIIRLKLKKLIMHNIIKYYNDILNKCKEIKYDYVFVINLEAMPESILKKLKKQQNKAEFILYMWDSLELKKISDRMLELFDKKFTFDYKDAKERGMILHPLFYSKEYKVLKNIKPLYDICFIGTIHGDRYKLLKEIENKAKQLGLKTYFYMYMPSRIMFWVRKVFDKSFFANYKEVKFKSMSSSNIAKLMNQSKSIVDLSYKNQRGLSMRTFEVLGVRKKLITTHKEVKKYDFYHKQNIKIIDKNNIQLDKDFFVEDYLELDDYIYEKYLLKQWLLELFNTK